MRNVHSLALTEGLQEISHVTGNTELSQFSKIHHLDIGKVGTCRHGNRGTLVGPIGALDSIYHTVGLISTSASARQPLALGAGPRAPDLGSRSRFVGVRWPEIATSVSREQLIPKSGPHLSAKVGSQVDSIQH